MSYILVYMMILPHSDFVQFFELIYYPNLDKIVKKG